MRFAIVVTLVFLLAACTTVRRTEPQRTATEEMLISSAADRAVDELKLNVRGKAVLVEASNYKGLDPEYTVAAVRALVVKDGGRLVTDRKTADVVIEMRNGAQSIDKKEFLIGIPSFDVPIPLAGSLTFPEIALYSRDEDIGVSKLAIADYSAGGASAGSAGPVYGFAHDRHYKALIFIGWRTQDFHPDEDAGTAKGD